MGMVAHYLTDDFKKYGVLVINPFKENNMTFKENFIAVVKCGGRIMREITDGCVHLPFGSEYTLLLKNKESRKAVVDIEIDGQGVLNGRELIINPNAEIELQGFMDGLVAKNAFRFIQKTNEIIDHRGDRVDDGIIRVSFRFERKVEERTIYHENHVNRYYYHDYYPYWDYPYYRPRPHSFWSDSIGSSFKGSTSAFQCCANLSNNSPLPDEGITVKGSEINQGFVNGYTSELETNAHVITIRLCGTNSKGSEIKEPITVKTQFKCVTCGKESKSSAKFCDKCGTALM